MTDYLGTSTHAYDKDGKEVWHRQLDIYGRCIKGNNDFIPFLYQGQYYDKETQLAYNRFRYYDLKMGMYISQDPIGLMGGMRFYSYALDLNTRLDIFGLFHHNDPGHNVYALYDIIGRDANNKPILADKPYYIGITNDPQVRELQHQKSGRAVDGLTHMKILDDNLTYGQARGYEQAYIEHHKNDVLTGRIGEDISQTNRGNKINSFDVNNTTRDKTRHQNFLDNRQNKLDELNGKKPHHH